MTAPLMPPSADQPAPEPTAPAGPVAATGITPDQPNALRQAVIAEALERARLRNKKPRFRAIFISDLHLGFKGSQAGEAARLLKLVKCDTLYLVGDVIDGWRLKSRWYWPDEHNDVIRRVLKLANKGTRVVFIPGNHDEVARQFCGLEFGGVEIKLFDIHETADGRKLFITHGDQFDLVIKHSRLLSLMGALAYEWLVRINILYNRARAFFGLRYWSLSHYLKMRVKKACTFISRFEEAVVTEARKRGLDGVVCGHIHKAERADFDGVQYINCGDWVESCTLAVEDEQGRVVVLNGDELIGVAPRRKARRKRRKREAAGQRAGHRTVADDIVKQYVPAELDPRRDDPSDAAIAGSITPDRPAAQAPMDPEVASMVRAVAHAHDDPDSVLATATRWLNDEHDDDEWRDEDWPDSTAALGRAAGPPHEANGHAARGSHSGNGHAGRPQAHESLEAMTPSAVAARPEDSACIEPGRPGPDEPEKTRAEETVNAAAPSTDANAEAIAGRLDESTAREPSGRG